MNDTLSGTLKRMKPCVILWLSAVPFLALAVGVRLWAQADSYAAQADDPPLKLPGWWKAGDPLPAEKTNCVRCHLTAGRELTVPLRDFARSVHDRAHMSCNDCHGGDTEKDATAHEHDKGFIGTKLSAHMTACSQCHGSEKNAFRKSKHYWDLKTSINRDYPVCVDCHGNHDVGKPPKDFALMNVCTDCHKDIQTKWPPLAAVVEENDRLWATLRQVHQGSKEDDPTPKQFREQLSQVRGKTAAAMHGTKILTKEEADSLNRQVIDLRRGLEAWLQQRK